MRQIIASEKPTVGITINKSRLKLYNKNNPIPVYYLQKGQEFQIELFNPTSDTLLAKIHLNSRMISQGGLVLRPGERVFLDRYFDIPNKFKFDTYEVVNSAAVQKAIQDNGDVKVEFFRERIIQNYYHNYSGTLNLCGNVGGSSFTTQNLGNNATFTGPSVKGITNAEFSTRSASLSDNPVLGASVTQTSCNYSSEVTCSDGSAITLDMMDTMDLEETHEPLKKDLAGARARRKVSKSIETGRVEVGSASNQKFETVHKNFEFYPFHTVEYKLLPVSQKVNTTEDMKVKIYCTNCGAKTKPEHKFCANCGTKQ